MIGELMGSHQTGMKSHRTCPRSGALLFDRTEGEDALDDIAKLARLVLTVVAQVNAGERVDQDTVLGLRALARTKA